MLKSTFRPEFLNRIDETIMFNKLDRSFINKIVEKQMKLVAKRLESRRITLEIGEDAVQFIADTGYDPQFGARPLKRAVQTYLENPLARALLSGAYLEGSVIAVNVAQDGSGLSFSKKN